MTARKKLCGARPLRDPDDSTWQPSCSRRALHPPPHAAAKLGTAAEQDGPVICTWSDSDRDAHGDARVAPDPIYDTFRELRRLSLRADELASQVQSACRAVEARCRRISDLDADDAAGAEGRRRIEEALSLLRQAEAADAAPTSAFLARADAGALREKASEILRGLLA